MTLVSCYFFFFFLVFSIFCCCFTYSSCRCTAPLSFLLLHFIFSNNNNYFCSFWILYCSNLNNQLNVVSIVENIVVTVDLRSDAFWSLIFSLVIFPVVVLFLFLFFMFSCGSLLFAFSPEKKIIRVGPYVCVCRHLNHTHNIFLQERGTLGHLEVLIKKLLEAFWSICLLLTYLGLT